jgi:hypothetical protein
VSNELSNYRGANRQPRLDDPGSFGTPGICIDAHLACFTPKSHSRTRDGPLIRRNGSDPAGHLPGPAADLVDLGDRHGDWKVVGEPVLIDRLAYSSGQPDESGFEGMPLCVGAQWNDHASPVSRSGRPRLTEFRLSARSSSRRS